MPPGKGRRNLEATPGPPDSVIVHTHHPVDIVHDTPIALLGHSALLYCTAHLSIDSNLLCLLREGKAVADIAQLTTIHQPFFLHHSLGQLCNMFNQG